MKKYKLVIFDLDGTLLDTSEGILSAAKYAISQSGRVIPNQDVLETYIGPPIQQSFAKTFGIEGKELDDMALLFRNQYKDIDLLKAEPYEGIYELCKSLIDKDFILAVATYKREDYALKLLEYYQFDKYMSIICGSDFAGQLTKADIIRKVIELSKVCSYDDVVMIGDTHHDAIGAEALGLDFIGVTYGFGYKSNSDIVGNNVVGVAHDTSEIGTILMGAK